MKSKTAENCVIFCTVYRIVFITLKDNKRVSVFSQMQQYILFYFYLDEMFRRSIDHRV
jgi:hypothetical protein